MGSEPGMFPLAMLLVIGAPFNNEAGAIVESCVECPSLCLFLLSDKALPALSTDNTFPRNLNLEKKKK